MTHALRVVALVAFGLAIPACGLDKGGVGIDGERAMAHVQALAAIGARPADSDGARAAVRYIAGELGKLELPVEQLTVPGTSEPDLLVRFGSNDPALYLLAHYDTVAGSPGAVDNAAAVAVLLELARAFHEDGASQPVVLAFTAAGEREQRGAEALANLRGTNALFVIALDRIGGDGALAITGASALIGSSELQWLGEAADHAGVRLAVPLPQRVIARRWPESEKADQTPFTRRNIKAVILSNHGNDGEWIDRANRTAQDVPSRVQRSSIEQAGRLVRALVALPTRSSTADGFWVPFATNAVIARWLLFALCGVLVLGAALGLLVGKDGVLAARKRDEPGARGAGLLAGFACFAAGAGAAVGAELALASKPMSWLADPLRALGSSAGIMAGAGGLIALGIGRMVPFRGELRYRLAAAITLLAIGGALLALDVAELAWIWLVPAMMIGVAPPPLAALSTALPAVFVLYPPLLREAAWNGVLPSGVPLAAWLAMLAVPIAASVAWVSRRYERDATWVLAVKIGVCVIALGGGIALAVL